MLAGNKALAVLDVCLHAAVRQVMLPSDVCQVYNFVSSLLLQPPHCCCSLFMTFLNAVAHQISSETVAMKHHNKAAMLIRTGPLYTDSFAIAEQDAGKTTGWHDNWLA